MVPNTRSRKSSFPQFMNLPKDIRLMIWKNALPDYGIYQVVLGRIVDEGSDSNSRAKFWDWHIESPTMTIGLALPFITFRAPAFSARIVTTRILLNTCRESRTEVQFHFPHSAPSPGGELRFHGVKDIISLMDFGFLQALVTSKSVLNLAFTGDWNMFPRRLAMGTRFSTENLLSLCSGQTATSASLTDLTAFQAFVSNFPNLQQLILQCPVFIPAATWNHGQQHVRERLALLLGKCYPTYDITKWYRLPERLYPAYDCTLTRTVAILDEFFPSFPAVQGIQEIDVRPPQLQGIDVHLMLNIHPELAWLCKEI